MHFYSKISRHASGGGSPYWLLNAPRGLYRYSTTIVPILQFWLTPRGYPSHCTVYRVDSLLFFIFVFEVLALLSTLYSLVVGFR